MPWSAPGPGLDAVLAATSELAYLRAPAQSTTRPRCGVLVPTEQEIIGGWYYRWYRESVGLGESL
jgi:hypothetical protein